MENHLEIRVAESKNLKLALITTGAFLLVELVGGLLTQSLALLADAGHMLVDFLSLLTSFFALSLALKPATKERTFGLYRLEILAALLNGITLAIICVFIFREAYFRILNPVTVNEKGMLLVALLGLIANGAAVYFLRHGETLNLRSALLHVLGDTFSSLAIIVGGIIIYFTGYYLIDPLLSLVIALIIFFSAYRVTVEAINILIEATPKEIEVDKLISRVREIPGVLDLHDLHIWTITSGLHALSAHLLLSDQLISKADQIIKQVEKVLSNEFGINHTTLQIECQTCQNGEIICQFNRKPNEKKS